MLEESTTINLEKQIQVGKPKVLEGHIDYVNSVFAKDNLIISGSGDKTIKIWDINSGSCLKTLEGHTDWINSVFVKDNLAISCSWYTIRIWDMYSGLCLKILKCHNSIESVFMKDNLIISGSWDKTISVTPVSLFPGELPVFQSVIDSYNLAPHLEREILDYLGC